MRWIQTNWLPLVFILAVFISSALSVRMLGEQHSDAIENCVRDQKRATMIFRFMESAADVHRKAQNQEETLKFEALSQGVLLSMPIPPSLKDRREMIQVGYVQYPNRKAARLTPEARKLQLAGCRHAYR